MTYTKDQFRFQLPIVFGSLTAEERNYINSALPEGTSLYDIDHIYLTVTMNLEGTALKSTSYHLNICFDMNLLDFEACEDWEIEYDPNSFEKSAIFRKLMQANSCFLHCPKNR